MDEIDFILLDDQVEEQVVDNDIIKEIVKIDFNF